ncbi:MAG TPA: ABC transporter substrate-binding protein [Opitutaceae bacterium]|jgi:phospholipid transport system substrate-binding protein|nr:ABC transporter substrate-binding protein [Opitutaceae bacterium]
MRFFTACFFIFALVIPGRSQPAAQAVEAGAPATAKELCDALIAAMKKGSSLDFAARRDLLAPVIQRDYDLAFMTRIVVGSPWRGFSPEDRQKLADAFSAFSIATYAQRFNSYSGEHFEVDPSPTMLSSRDCIVHTKLFTGDPEPVQLDYLMRKTGGRWRIIDVYLSGTISEMAARRSEYSSAVRQGGAPALIELLTKKAAELASQRPGSS